MIGIAMPSDFPNDENQAIWGRLTTHQKDDEERFGECGAALLGITRRFKAAADHDEAYIKAISRKGRGSPQDQVYRQDKELFDFFINGYAVLDCFVYGAYFIGSLVQPSGFPLVGADDRHKINVKKTTEAYLNTFKTESISDAISEVFAYDRTNRVYVNAEYEAWSQIRNVIAHRSHPGRMHYLSTTPAMDRPSEWRVVGMPVLDATTTASRRAWLAGTLQHLLKTMEGFVWSRL